jgi:LysM repeat protein
MMVTVKMIDCATQLSAGMVEGLKAAGVTHVGRYLGPESSWKALLKNEVDAIKKAGLQVVSIFETNPTRASYFSKAKGTSDAQDASNYAKVIGQPKGTAIYFAVDYDAQPGDMATIKAYFDGVKSAMKDYKVGVYGSYDVVTALKGKVGFYWQTYAWSEGKVADHIHIHQYKNGQRLAGIEVDFDEVLKEPGAWGAAKKEDKSNPKPKPTSQKITTYTVKKGDTLWAIAKKYSTTVSALAKLNGIENPDLIYPGQKLKISGDTAKQSSTKVYVVKKGDTLSGIAARYNTTVTELVKLNKIKNPDLIFPGQKIKLP